MPGTTGIETPGLASFLSSVTSDPLESSIERLISLLKRRQVRTSKSCAVATAQLMRQSVKTVDATEIQALIENIKSTGHRLAVAQPKELAIGNIVRRVLGLIRDEAEENRDPEADGASKPSSGGQANHWRQNDARSCQDFSLSPSMSAQTAANHDQYQVAITDDFRAEIIEGIQEIIDELDQADDQIASFAPDHIHPHETILTHSLSTTTQRFLLKAAAKRKFTVFCTETYPNESESIHASLVDDATGTGPNGPKPQRHKKTLTAAGITVVLIPDSAVFAVMSRVNKVILDAHVVLADGSFIASAGAKLVAKAANVHRAPVVVLGGVYKLSPVYPFDTDALIEYGEANKIIKYEEGDLLDKVFVENPLQDHVPADLVDLYITNLGGHAPSYLYRIIADHYRAEDMDSREFQQYS